MNHSVEQKKALDMRPADRIVSAQAGAGKTGVLVDRILQSLLGEDAEGNPAPQVGLENMLVVTFTNKAAGELKNRIRKAIVKQLREHPAKRGYLLQQLNYTASANIQTMHAFCLEQIRREFDRIGRDPAMRILGSRDVARLKDEALRETMEMVYRQEPISDALFSTTPEEVLAFAERYIDPNRRDDQNLRNLIWDWFEICNNQTQPEAWTVQTVRALDQPEMVDSLLAQIFERLSLHVQEILGALREMEAMDLGALSKKLPDFSREESAMLFRAILPAGMEWKEECAPEKREGFLAHWKQSLPGVFFGRQPAIRIPKGDVFLASEKEAYQTLRGRVKEAAGEMQRLVGLANREELAKQQSAQARDMRILTALTGEFSARFGAAKEEENGLDFSDVEHLMVALLQEEEVCQQLRDRYRYVFFDEYQDANAMQEYIVEKMAPEKGLFFVGDIKQSIYGFRQAVPENFLRRYESYQKAPDAEAIDMTLNFRSEPEVLTVINGLCAPLMTQDRVGFDYDTEAHRASPFRPFAGKGKVTLTILQDASADEDNEEGQSFLDEISSEMYYVAHHILAHVRSGGHFRDCVILLRNKSSIPDYRHILSLFEIPHFTDADPRHEESTELTLAYGLLRWLDNGRDDLALLTSLLSVIGDWSEAEVAAMRAAHPAGPFAEAFFEAQAEDLPQLLEQKRADFLHFRTIWRRRLKEMPLSEWMDAVFEQSGLYGLISGMSQGQARLGNVEALLRLCAGFEEQHREGLTAFLEYAATASEEADDMRPASPLSEEDDVVRLMTIHASKGLQFPVVFLGDLAHSFSNKTQSKPLIADPEAGAALRIQSIEEETGRPYQMRSLHQQFLTERAVAKERAEETRLLYVAMTRAVQELVLVGTVKKWKNLIPVVNRPLQEQLDRDRSYLQWMVHILRQDVAWQQAMLPESDTDAESASESEISASVTHLPEENPLRAPLEPLQNGFQARPRRDMAPGEELPPLSAFFSIRLEEGETYRTLAAVKEESTQKASSVPNSGAVEEVLGFVYPHQDATSLPLKRTVSQLSKKNQILEEHFNAWPQYTSEESEAPEAPALPEASVASETSEAPLRKLEWQEENLFPLPEFLRTEQPPDAAERGTLMHRALQNLPLMDYTEETMKQMLDAMVQRELFTANERQSLDERALLKFFASPLGQAVKAHKDAVQRERSFTLRIPLGSESIAVDGQMDLFVETPEGVVLVDFKTDRHPDAEKYLLQLAFYAEAMRRSGAKKLRGAYLYWVRTGRGEAIAPKRLKEVLDVELARLQQTTPDALD